MGARRKPLGHHHVNFCCCFGTVDVDVETETCSIGPIMHDTIVYFKAMYFGSNESMLVKEVTDTDSAEETQL